MNKINELTVTYVKTMPEVLEDGILYISLEYGVAIHKCCCGTCGFETVMPFVGDDAWQLIKNADDTVTFRPSVGNWQFPCRSHYFIINNKIQWL